MKVYSVQIQVDGFGNDTWVAFLGDSRKSCEEWIKKHSDYIKETSWHGKRDYVILEHTLNNDEFRNYYDE